MVEVAELKLSGASICQQRASMCEACRVGKMVEAAGVEPASETTSNRELSCFFQVLFCLVNGAKNGRRYAVDQSDRSHSLRPDGTRRASLLCDAPEHARRRSVRERLLI